MERYSKGISSFSGCFGLSFLKTEGDVQRFDGEPMSIEEKAAWNSIASKRSRRNYRRRQRYAAKRYERMMDGG